MNMRLRQKLLNLFSVFKNNLSRDKIYSNLSKIKTLPHRKGFLFFSAILIFVAIFYPNIARAEILTFLFGGAIAGLGGIVGAGAIFAGILWLFLALSTYLIDQSVFILNWAVTSPFHMSFTNPANNMIIELGWTLVRDFTNMLFILGLAYIGLATALNFAKFNTDMSTNLNSIICDRFSNSDNIS